MKIAVIGFIMAFSMVAQPGPAHSQHNHGHNSVNGVRSQNSEKMPRKSHLKPAQGASVKIISPKPGQVIKGDAVTIEYQMNKGRVGEHVHAYVDGELAGMFKTTKGTLTGIKPGKHILELRIATEDHNVELDAIDQVHFVVR